MEKTCMRDEVRGQRTNVREDATGTTVREDVVSSMRKMGWAPGGSVRGDVMGQRGPAWCRMEWVQGTTMWGRWAGSGMWRVHTTSMSKTMMGMDMAEAQCLCGRM